MTTASPLAGADHRGAASAQAEVDTTGCSHLVELLRSKFQSASYHPPLLPGAAVQLMELARKPEVEFREIRAVLETEPVLTASVLRLSQSPIYRRVEPIRTIDQAITRLGTRTLADLFLHASTSARIFRAPGFDRTMAGIQSHSIATAHVARLLGRYLPWFEEYAFMVGLLHDVGAAAAILVLPEILGSNARVSERDQGVTRAVFDVHEECGEIVARAWNLPPHVAMVIGHHQHFKVGPRPELGVAAICVAETVATGLGAGVGADCDPIAFHRAVQALGMSPADLVDLHRAAADVLARGNDD
jgi:HD-like signal output (HDOD) protein